MSKELKRRSRLAAALIAGPAVTVGMLGAGAAPVMAQEEPDPQESDAVEEQVDEEGDPGDDPTEDGNGEAGSDGSDNEDDSDDGDEGSEGEGESADDGADEEPDVDPSDVDELETSSEEVSLFQAQDADEVEFSVNGSIVEFTGLPAGTSDFTVTANDENVSPGAPNEGGSLTFDAAEYISTLNLDPGENTLTFSWTWFEDNEDLDDSVDVTVDIEAPDEDEVTFEVDGSVITGTGFPESVFIVDIQAPSGSTTTATVEDGTLTFDALDAINVLDLEYGEQTLTFSWEWTDDFGDNEDSQEVNVTAVPPLETGEDLSIEEIIAGLIGDDTSIDNVQSIGEGFQIGQFSGWDALGIPAGTVLSTGNLPASWQAMTGTGSGSFSDSLDGEGDSDLDAILESATEDGSTPETQDAAGLEFSFVPQEANIRFSYVFASDEYTFLDGSDEPGGSVNYNDIFAFFVNGQNYALFESEDGETLPVSIENINSVANSELYNSNLVGDGGERPNSGTEIGGYTNVLTFTAPVNPGELNTIKLAVADVNDGIYDSFVVLQSGSFEQVQGPVAQGGEFVTNQGEAVGDDFELMTDSDDPEWSIEVTDGIDEDAGDLQIDGTSWEFTPADDFTGEVSFTFTANDGSLTSSPATISITVVDPADDDDITPPEEEEDATPPEDDEDDDVTPSEDEDDDYVPAGDPGTDDAPAAKGPAADTDEAAADKGEELATTGMTGRDAGLASALLLLVGGGLAALGYKNRLGRRGADA